MKHHEFSPSSLDRFSSCPASYFMGQGIPEQTSKDADKGIDLHSRIEKDKDAISDLSTDDQILIIKSIQCMETIAPWKNWKREIKVSIVDDDFSKITFGTVDAIFEDEKIVYAIDFKFGWNKVNEVRNNSQARTYVAGLIQTYNKPVQFIIFQPSINFKSESYFEETEVGTIIYEIKEVIKECKSTKMIFNPSEPTCRYCKAKDTCMVHNRVFESSALKTIEHTAEIIDPNQMSDYLEQWKLIQKKGKSLEFQAKKMLMENIKIPNFGLMKKSGSRKVSDANGIYNILSQILSHEEVMKYVDFTLGKICDAYCKVLKAGTLKEYLIAEGMPADADEMMQEHWVKKLKASRKGISLENAKAQFMKQIEPFVERSDDSFQLKHFSEKTIEKKGN